MGNMKSFVAAVMKIDEIKDLLYEQACDEINSEIQRLCSKSDPAFYETVPKRPWSHSRGVILIKNCKTGRQDLFNL